MARYFIKSSIKPVNYWVIIPAAGVGKRMGQALPKQYLTINNKTLLEYSIAIFSQIKSIKKIILALNPADNYWKKLSIADSLVEIIHGGAERSHSVLNGLRALAGCVAADDWILVHDAVRPCLTQHDLSNLLNKLADHPVGGLLASPVSQTLKQADENRQVIKTVDRSNLWQAQTPQMFRYSILTTALERALADRVEITDEASAVEYLGYQPLIIEGSPSNIKVTQPADLELAKRYLSN